MAIRAKRGRAKYQAVSRSRRLGSLPPEHRLTSRLRCPRAFPLVGGEAVTPPPAEVGPCATSVPLTCIAPSMRV